MTVSLYSLISDARAETLTSALAAVDAVNTSVAAIVYTTVAANIATLVADAASPTQAHVTTLNTNWTALKALIDAAVVVAAAAPTAQGHNATLTVDVTDIGSITKLTRILNAFKQIARGSGLFTE